MKKTIFLALSLGASCLCVNAQEKLLKLKLETRFDYQREYLNSSADHDNSGFKGRYFIISFDGTINDKLSYAYRQRLNKDHSDQSFFDATDWAYVKYKPNRYITISGGKEVVAIGGYEYDRNPVDIFYASEFWNNISPFQLGATFAFSPNDGKDKLLAQVTESPFRNNAPDMYSFNLMWYGNHGCLGTMYSANMVEVLPGKYISYIALGHKLTFGKLSLEADFMNRATDEHTYFFKDCSVVAELAYRPIDKLNLFGKVTYDVNKTNSNADFSVFAGTETTSLGGGVEYFPHKTIRLHAAYAHSFGTSKQQDNIAWGEYDKFCVGLTWNVNLLSLKNPWM